MTDEIECPDCAGYGWISNREPTTILGDCPACKGKGWREPTQEELNDRAARAINRSAA